LAKKPRTANSKSRKSSKAGKGGARAKGLSDKSEASYVGGVQVRALMQHVVDGIVIIDSKGIIRDFNRAAERLFGYASDETVGRNVSILMPEPYHSAHDGYIERYLRTGEARIIGIGREVVGRRKDGSVFPMDLSIGEVPDGPVRHFVGSIRDLSERKAMERQLLHASKMEAMGQLTGGVAHDFNNLLAVLMMDLEILDDLTREQESCRELVREARDIAQSAADLTRRLLAFARRQPLQPTSVDLTGLIADTTGLLRRTLGATVEVDTFAPSDMWPIRVDRAQLESSILNLALNARDAMSSGGRLSITASNVTLAERMKSAPELALGDYVRIDVADTGVGMTDDVLARAFEPFFTTKAGRGGTGLGLATVYGFVRQSGGHVEIESKVGHGTTVRLYLPRAMSPQIAAPGGTKPRSGAGEIILIVEDDWRLRARGRATLQEFGYGTLEAAHAAEALEALQSTADIALLFSDIVMPGGMDGVELARKAKTLRPQLKVLLTSGYAEYSEESVGSVSPTGILRKPYLRDELAECVRAALDAPT
jgi:PAS domain S-box-containing protein